MTPPDERVQIADVEVSRAVLDQTGDHLARVLSADQRPALAAYDDEPRDRAVLDGPGWRQISDDDRLRFGLVTYARPAADQSGWWVLQLVQQQDGWHAVFNLSPRRERPTSALRSAGLVLRWPEGPLTVTPAELDDLRVLLGRVGPGDEVLPLDWDDEDRSHVVGWLQAESDHRPATSWVAAGGWGVAVVPDESGFAPLPIHWMAHDVVGLLAPGRYRVTATLTGLGVRSSSRRCDVVSDS